MARGNVKKYHFSAACLVFSACLLVHLLPVSEAHGSHTLASSDGLVRYQFDSLSDELCAHAALKESSGDLLDSKQVSSDTLEAHKEYCHRLKARSKRQAVPGTENIRDIASSGASIAGILGPEAANIPLIFPDTKWCGEGTVATGFDDLGKERLADLCCRTHDHCPKSLSSSEYKAELDLKNPIAYTMSECSCDDEFRRCLDANEGLDWASALIKDIYQNVLKTPCMKFMHPLKCVKKDQSSRAECDTFEFDKTRQARWFVVEHPVDTDGPDFKDAQGRSLKPKEPTFAEREGRVETPTRAYTFDMVAKAEAEEVKNEKISKIKSLIQQSRRQPGAGMGM